MKPIKQQTGKPRKGDTTDYWLAAKVLRKLYLYLDDGRLETPTEMEKMFIWEFLGKMAFGILPTNLEYALNNGHKGAREYGDAFEELYAILMLDGSRPKYGANTRASFIDDVFNTKYDGILIKAAIKRAWYEDTKQSTK